MRYRNQGRKSLPLGQYRKYLPITATRFALVRQVPPDRPRRAADTALSRAPVVLRAITDELERARANIWKLDQEANA